MRSLASNALVLLLVIGNAPIPVPDHHGDAATHASPALLTHLSRCHAGLTIEDDSHLGWHWHFIKANLADLAGSSDEENSAPQPVPRFVAIGERDHQLSDCTEAELAPCVERWLAPFSEPARAPSRGSFLTSHSAGDDLQALIGVLRC